MVDVAVVVVIVAGGFVAVVVVVVVRLVAVVVVIVVKVVIVFVVSVVVVVGSVVVAVTVVDVDVDDSNVLGVVAMYSVAIQYNAMPLVRTGIARSDTDARPCDSSAAGACLAVDEK